MRNVLACLLPCLLFTLLAAPLHAQDVFQEGQPITIELQNGDKLTGILEKADGDKLIILHPILGRLEIARASIKPPKPPEVTPVEPWTGTFSLSLTGSEGNTDNTNFRTDLGAKHDYEEGVDTFMGWFRRSSEDNNTDEEKTFLQLRHEWKINESKWRPFVQGSWERDISDAWESQAAVAAGVAYQFKNGPVHALQGRVGLGASHKYVIDDDVEDDIEATQYEGVLGFDWYWTISETRSFAWTTDYYPSLNDSPEYRYVTRLVYDNKVEPDSPWFIRLGADDTYDSQPGPGNRGHDINYYAGIGRSF